MGEAPSIYDWIGGTEAIGRWLNTFYDAVERDELVGPVFGGAVTTAHREHVTAWWAEVMGGPAEYTERLGGYEHMLVKHRGLAITAEQRLRFVTLLSAAADTAGLPADPEARSALMAYAEWGSRLAVENSAPDATPVERAPVPRWGWGEAPPYLRP
jgi:hemoglobin